MKHLFVPYHIALALKQKGYDEPSLAMYKGNGDKPEDFKWLVPEQQSTVNNTALATFGQAISAPLYQQVVDWFRNIHDIVISVDHQGYVKRPSGLEHFFMAKVSSPDMEPDETDDFVRDYYDALDDGILEALKFI